MKKWIIASCVCCFPLILFGIVNPILSWSDKNKVIEGNYTYLVYILIIAVCLGVVMTTIVLISRYTGKIDHLDKAEKFYMNKAEEADRLINHYNELIKSQSPQP